MTRNEKGEMRKLRLRRKKYKTGESRKKEDNSKECENGRGNKDERYSEQKRQEKRGD